jgi:CRISPR/Cas system CSM-associated protein Csm3 (group 7 of RAMP superfamily)
MSQQRRGDYGGPPRLPKPYGFVRVDPLTKQDRKHPAGHAEYKAGTMNGTLRGELLARTPLHVASGTLEMTQIPEAPLVKAHVRSGGRPVVPGSSLKGAIRSIVEAISLSCLRITRARDNQLPRETAGCWDEKSLCVACRRFGSLGYQGQVRFGDAVLRKGMNARWVKMPALYAPRGRAGLYFERGQVKGRKFYRHGRPATGDTPVEVCPPGALLDFALQFENLQPAELGLLLIALGQGEPRLYPTLGGGKPACYGSVEVRVAELEIFEAMEAAYADYDAVAVTQDWRPYLEAAESLVLQRQLNELAALLRLDPGRSCPEGDY